MCFCNRYIHTIGAEINTHEHYCGNKMEPIRIENDNSKIINHKRV